MSKPEYSGGVNPPQWGWHSQGKRWGLYRADIVGYMERWVLAVHGRMARLHHILRPDLDPNCHDHPMDFVSLILKGGYTEECLLPDGRLEHRTYRAGQTNRKRAEDLHRIIELHGDTWTLLLTGPLRKVWGFQTPSGWVDYRTYLQGTP